MSHAGDHSTAAAAEERTHPAEMPLVSVVVTSLNRPEYLRSSCESILGGSYANVEVFICDDASDDPEVRQAAKSIAAEDGRVTVIQNQRRLGQFRSISRALSQVRGKYFAILNDDDLWGDEFLARLVPPLEADLGLVASFCDHWAIDRLGAVDQRATDRLSRECHRDDLPPGRHEDSGGLSLGLSAFPTVVASVFRTSAVDLDSYLSPAMDPIGFYDLWLQICVLGDRKPVWFEPRRLSSYRLHDGQLSARPSTALGRAKAWILEEALDRGAFGRSESSIVRRLAMVNHAIGMTYLREGNARLARVYLWRACSSRRPARSLVGLLLASELALRTITPLLLRRLGADAAVHAA